MMLLPETTEQILLIQVLSACYENVHIFLDVSAKQDLHKDNFEFRPITESE